MAYNTVAKLPVKLEKAGTLAEGWSRVFNKSGDPVYAYTLPDGKVLHSKQPVFEEDDYLRYYHKAAGGGGGGKKRARREDDDDDDDEDAGEDTPAMAAKTRAVVRSFEKLPATEKPKAMKQLQVIAGASDGGEDEEAPEGSDEEDDDE